ncbi:histidinol-phosphate transaminase [Streptomyces sp. LS1784]|uniref:histidinol-phosphate transaminase n=1 Tax=Streptomyces sp. LS1784 TaxID=2851533 RepID=UPI001CC9243E|nr:histidinol-phosphate transaminase [Streptomyces sp. LS1784]
MVSIADLPIRPELKGLTAYGAPQLDVPVRLNTNENPYPLPDGLVAEIAARLVPVLRELNRYPDRDAVALRIALAKHLEGSTGVALSERQVWAANGSNEVIQQLLQAFGGPGRVALGFEPSYAVHREIARSTGTRWVSAPRAADFTIAPAASCAAIAEHRPQVVFITAPNNPTGTGVSADTVAALYDAAQEAGPSLVVLDEAYVEFQRTPSLLPLIAGRPLLVVVRTLSKGLGLAGLRLGYLAGCAAVVEALQLVRLPYHLSAPTQAVALTVLEHAPALLANIERITAERDRLVRELRAAGYEVAASEANFVQFGRFRDTRRAWREIAARGALVRDSEVPSWLRVSVGTQAENDVFLAAVHERLP